MNINFCLVKKRWKSINNPLERIKLVVNINGNKLTIYLVKKIVLTSVRYFIISLLCLNNHLTYLYLFSINILDI